MKTLGYKILVSAVAITCLAAGLTLGSSPSRATGFTPPRPLILPRCLRPVNSMQPTKLGTVAGKPAANSKASAPVSPYAVVEVEIKDFDPAYPPEIRIFDDTKSTSTLLETIQFAPNPTLPCPPYTDLKVPVFLAYDHDPWSRPDKEPEERITRIEVHHGSISQPLLAYVKLKKGVFVVPVYWHNLAKVGGKSYVDPLDIMALFWTAPNGYEYNDLNAIWGQAGVQFRLLNTSIPFHVGAIPTHYLAAPNSPSVANCLVGWKDDYNDKKGVDIYTLESISYQGSGDPYGLGNCHGFGAVFIRAGDPNSAKPGFTDPYYLPQAKAELVAHEFGHFLASLPHKDTSCNLMHSQTCGPKLEQDQIDLARQRIKNAGTYYESK